MTTVIFWDIDGTLVSTGGAGRFAWAEAANEVCGGPLNPDAVTTGGLTDVEIAADIWRRLGDAGDPGQIERFVKPVLRDGKIASLAITEPGAGSDVGAFCVPLPFNSASTLCLTNWNVSWMRALTCSEVMPSDNSTSTDA